MSESRTLTVACPLCGHEQPFESWDCLHAEANPELKDSLLAGTLTLLMCKECGANTDVLHPLLYQDGSRHLMVWLVPGEGRPEPVLELFGDKAPELLTSYQFRLVRSLNALKEKVLIADAGLDDRVMELFKVLLRRDPATELHPRDHLLFAGLESEDGGAVLAFVVLRGGEEMGFSVPFETYARFAEGAEEHAGKLFPPTDRWWVVDEESTARRIVECGLE